MKTIKVGLLLLTSSLPAFKGCGHPPPDKDLNCKVLGAKLWEEDYKEITRWDMFLRFDFWQQSHYSSKRDKCYVLETLNGQFKGHEDTRRSELEYRLKDVTEYGGQVSGIPLAYVVSITQIKPYEEEKRGVIYSSLHDASYEEAERYIEDHMDRDYAGEEIKSQESK
jgi:hypothetical protein